jgi:hypothetical protein
MSFLSTYTFPPTRRRHKLINNLLLKLSHYFRFSEEMTQQLAESLLSCVNDRKIQWGNFASLYYLDVHLTFDYVNSTPKEA